jgi:hypothetical protein
MILWADPEMYRLVREGIHCEARIHDLDLLAAELLAFSKIVVDRDDSVGREGIASLSQSFEKERKSRVYNLPICIERTLSWTCEVSDEINLDCFALNLIRLGFER